MYKTWSLPPGLNLEAVLAQQDPSASQAPGEPHGDSSQSNEDAGPLPEEPNGHDDQESLDQFIMNTRNSLTHSLDDRDRIQRLNSLADALSRRFARLGEMHDMDEAISAQKQAATLARDDYQQLYRLAKLLIQRYEHFGDLEDLDDAIDTFLEAKELVPVAHTDRTLLLEDLAAAFNLRSERLGGSRDITSAIDTLKEVLNLTPSDHVSRPLRLVKLASMLNRRFELVGRVQDINDAIDAQTLAVVLTTDDHANKLKLLDDLAALLRKRSDLDLEDTNPNPQSTLPLSAADRLSIDDFNSALYRQYGHPTHPSDLELAILVQREALDLTPASDTTNKANRLSALGSAYGQLFDRSGSPQDLDHAIACQQQALDLTPDGNANKPSMLTSLGKACVQRFQHQGTPADEQHAVQLFRTAATYITGQPIDLFNAARAWAEYNPAWLEAHHVLVALIPRIAWLGRSMEQRFEQLEIIGDTVLNAVSAACKPGAFFAALEWLEQGRSIIWGQILHLRSPKQALRALYPQLATELDNIIQQLESGTVDDQPQDQPQDQGPESLPLSLSTDHSEVPTQVKDMTQFYEQPKYSASHVELVQKWEDLLSQIREMPEFNDFLLPKRAITLIEGSTRSGVVVVVEVSKYGCYALILQPGVKHINHVPLQRLSLEKVQDAQTMMLNTLSNSGLRSGGTLRKDNRGSATRKTGLNYMEKTLRMLWTDIAQPIINHLGFVHSVTPLPHVTWCLTGALASLPLHAAGKYDTPAAETKIYNYMISSYTPSVTALLRSSATPREFHGVFALTQAATPGLSPLPGTITEVDQVQAILKNGHKICTRVDGRDATVKAVADGVMNHSWIHFSCHASQNAIPTKSAFHLYDGPLEIAKIVRRPPQYAELAYLSACQTASGDSKLPDESIHLAAAMIYSGFKSVVATLWSIRDDDAPIVASVFYEHLLQNPDGVAQALHAAVSQLRDKVGEKNHLAWVPFIHMGQ